MSDAVADRETIHLRLKGLKPPRVTWVRKVFRRQGRRLDFGLDQKRGLWAVGLSLGRWRCASTLSVSLHLGPWKLWVSFYHGKPLDKQQDQLRRTLFRRDA